MKPGTRIDRERNTIEVMIDLYCQGNHGSDTLCRECSSLSEYVQLRLDHCPFKDNKPTCVNCTVHCYASLQRIQIRNVMRFSGPRMIYRHPMMALYHMVDGIKYRPNKKRTV
jgi:hypothetical protein